MALDALHVAEIIEALELFLLETRPPKEIRHQVDIMYQIDGQSVIIFEVRPHWAEKGEFIETPFAKTTWVETTKSWKLFWRRGNLKWNAYAPHPEAKTITEVLKLVKEDKHNCFFG